MRRTAQVLAAARGDLAALEHDITWRWSRDAVEALLADATAPGSAEPNDPSQAASDVQLQAVAQLCQRLLGSTFADAPLMAALGAVRVVVVNPNPVRYGLSFLWFPPSFAVVVGPAPQDAVLSGLSQRQQANTIVIAEAAAAPGPALRPMDPGLAPASGLATRLPWPYRQVDLDRRLAALLMAGKH